MNITMVGKILVTVQTY